MQSYAQEVKDAYGIELAVRIGINTGPVVVGMEARRQTDDPWNALGDTVNVAARLQNIAPEGGIVIGPTTERQIEDCFEVEELGPPELKGISKKLTQVYKVVGAREMRARWSPHTPIVGRDYELSVLERTMEGLVEGRGAIVSMMGEPGIGKRRLVWEVRSRYRDRVRFIEGRSRLLRADVPLLADPRPPARMARGRRLDAGGARPAGAEGGARATLRRGLRGGLPVLRQPARA